ncbi:MAG: hypothetical protein NC191_09415 [Muribaculaceae bacterium]|nr:hypothetical protein [Muribaculaceae bacterium]
MHETIKYTWLCLAFFTLCGLLAMIPYDKMQKAYMSEYYRIKYEPLRRIEATYKYIDEIENGSINVDNGIDFETYLKSISTPIPTQKTASKPVKKYQKPLYVRDKNNPNILHPYRKNL